MEKAVLVFHTCPGFLTGGHLASCPVPLTRPAGSGYASKCLITLMHTEFNHQFKSVLKWNIISSSLKNINKSPHLCDFSLPQTMAAAGRGRIGCNFLRLITLSLPSPLCASLASFRPPPLPSPASLLVCVLVLAAAVSPEVKQSAVIYQCVIGPIWEPRKPGRGCGAALQSW